MARLYELVMTGRYFDQQIINRFNYLMSGTPAVVTGSFALTSAFGAIYDEVAIPPGYPSGTLLANIMGILSNDFVLDQVTVLAPGFPTDFYETPLVPALTGAQAGASASPVLAYGFKSNRVRTDIGRGMKRFVGVVEDYMGEGGVIVGMSGLLDALAAKMGEILTYDDEGNTLSFSPVVVGKEKYQTSGELELPVTWAYRYYPDPEVQLEHLAEGVSWQWYPSVRTQRSRQYGNGR